MILGIGMNGHIGFNEPGSNQNTVTRKVRISDNSREILSNDFNSQKDVPNEAITLGIKTILSAKKYIYWHGEQESLILLKRRLRKMLMKSVQHLFLENIKI